MAPRFGNRVIPKTPEFKRDMYEVPKSYSIAYEEKRIVGSDRQRVFFYGTQFGGFRVRRLPKYLAEIRPFIEDWFKSKRDGRYTTFRPNSNFLRDFGDLEVEPLLRRRYKEPVPSQETLVECGLSAPEAKEIKDLQDRLNEFYSKVRLDILDPPISGITPSDRIELSRFNGIPHFRYSPRAGNRLTHSGPGSSFQSISSILRPLVTINGEETTEIDISAASIQFMNLVIEKISGKPFISKSVLSKGDPYQPFLDVMNGSSGSLDRESLKEILYTLVYSDVRRQKNQVNRKLRLLGHGDITYDMLEHWFKDFFEAIEKLKAVPLDSGFSKDYSVLPFINGFYEPHILIFREESAFARDVLRRSCLEEGFPVLPIHDSFMTPRKHGRDLERIVTDVSRKRYGYVLGHKTKF